MASDQGCLNCHYSESRSSPTLQSLAGKLKRDAERQPAEQALQGMLREMRGQSGIHSHQMVTDESVLVILQWLAQGTTEG